MPRLGAKFGFMLSLIAIGLLFVSIAFVLGQVRNIAEDAFSVMKGASLRMYRSGFLTQYIAFLLLWGLIFVLCFV